MSDSPKEAAVLVSNIKVRLVEIPAQFLLSVQSLNAEFFFKVVTVGFEKAEICVCLVRASGADRAPA